VKKVAYSRLLSDAYLTCANLLINVKKVRLVWVNKVAY